ncbi:MAG: formylglycine-generating enzyme family protein, partial [Xenococcus sp. (in: cyanobacteria)]
LLSDLCRPVGYELYVMDEAVRAYLLKNLEQNDKFGAARIKEIARLLLSYIQHLAKTNPFMSSKELQTQRWGAMLYVNTEETVKEIASAFNKCLDNKAELAHLVRITEKFKDKISQSNQVREFLDYAQLVNNLLIRPAKVNLEAISRSYQASDVNLIVPEILTAPIINRVPVTQVEGFPPLKDLEYEISTIVLLEGIELLTQQFEVAEIELSIFETFEFTTAKLERQQKQPGLFQRLNLFRRNESITEWVIREQKGEAQRLIEELNETVTLEMVLIPAGEFMMGAAPEEIDSSSNELPQHQVKIQKAFMMARYPITQEQWRAVAAMPQVNRELEPAPSRFQGDMRPVESVNWYEAVEFCQRLSQHTGREYRLPSEAEWEYACRAGTSTPFHFGETITTDLANYRSTDDKEYNLSGSYSEGLKGEYRQETTTVDKFGIANDFGLCEMHGLVWEWCEDDWHSNYEDAPKDGSAWLTESSSTKVLRGGGWANFPIICRSASRNDFGPESDDLNYGFGFRVVCRVPRTL